MYRSAADVECPIAINLAALSPPSTSALPLPRMATAAAVKMSNDSESSVISATFIDVQRTVASGLHSLNEFTPTRWLDTPTHA